MKPGTREKTMREKVQQRMRYQNDCAQVPNSEKTGFFFVFTKEAITCSFQNSEVIHYLRFGMRTKDEMPLMYTQFRFL